MLREHAVHVAGRRSTISVGKKRTFEHSIIVFCLNLSIDISDVWDRTTRNDTDRSSSSSGGGGRCSDAGGGSGGRCSDAGGGGGGSRSRRKKAFGSEILATVRDELLQEGRGRPVVFVACKLRPSLTTLKLMGVSSMWSLHERLVRTALKIFAIISEGWSR